MRHRDHRLARARRARRTAASDPSSARAYARTGVDCRDGRRESSDAVRACRRCRRVTVERDIPLEMADGVTLYADVYRPGRARPSPRPADQPPVRQDRGGEQLRRLRPPVLVRAPRLHRRQRRTAAAAIARRAPSTRSATRRTTSRRTIEWCARAAGRDGRVATYGFSYPGLNQLLAAQTGPPALESDLARVHGRQPVRRMVLRAGRLLARVRGVVGELPRARRGGARARTTTPSRRTQAPSASAQRALLGTAAHRASSPRRPSDTPVLPRLARPPDLRRLLAAVRGRPLPRSTLPGLHVGGWYDVFVRGTVRSYRELARAGTRPAEARRRAVVPHALVPARRRSRATSAARSSTTGSCASGITSSRARRPASSTRRPRCTS